MSVPQRAADNPCWFALPELLQAGSVPEQASGADQKGSKHLGHESPRPRSEHLVHGMLCVTPPSSDRRWAVPYVAVSVMHLHCRFRRDRHTRT